MEPLNQKEQLANNAYETKCIELQKYLRKTMRLLLDDGRTVEGRLQCFDSSLNMILVNTVEIMADSQYTFPIGRLIVSDGAIKQYQTCSCV